MADKDQLELDRAESFIKHECTAQRIGVSLMALFALAGAAGVFGNGAASHAQQSANGIRIQYERFGRQTVRSSFDIIVDTHIPDGEPVTVRVERTFFSRVSMVEVRPPNAHTALDEDSAIFQVPASGGRAHLELHYEPQKTGRLRATIAVAGGGSVSVTQLVYF